MKKDTSHKWKWQESGVTIVISEKNRSFSRWQGNKTCRSPLLPQRHNKFICKWNNSYRTLSESWQKPSDFQKGKDKVGKKIKVKKEIKVFRTETCTPGREIWRRKIFHTLKNPLTGEVRKEFCILRGEWNSSCLEAKMGDHCWKAIPRQ